MQLTYIKRNAIIMLSLVWFNLGYISGKSGSRVNKDLCRNSKQECDGRCWCYDHSKPVLKTCDPETLDFKCLCASSYNPVDDPKVYFSVLVHKCQLALVDCRGKCSTKGECYLKCEEEYDCLTDAQRGPGADLCNGDGNNNDNNGSNNNSSNITLDDLGGSGSRTVLGFTLTTASLVASAILTNQIA